MKTVTQSQGGQNIVFGASENQYQRSLATKSGVAEKCHVQVESDSGFWKERRRSTVHPCY